MKVVMLSLNDNTGSGYKIAEAVNTTSNIFVEYMVLLDDLSGHNAYKYPYLYKKKFGVDNGWEVPKRILESAQQIVDEADIIHLKGDEIPKNNNFYGIIIPDKPKIITVGGSFFRRGNSSVAFQQSPIQDYLDYFDIRTALTPDLNYSEFDGIYTPHASKYIEYKWERKDIPIINHTFAPRDKKGTKMFLDAVAILKERGINFEVKITKGVNNKESLKNKSEATIYHDQISDVGWHGMAAIESMSFGIPTTAYLSDDALRRGNIKNTKVVNCGNTVKELADTFEKLLNSNLKKLSKDSFEYAKDTYSYDVVGKLWKGIYEGL